METQTHQEFQIFRSSSELISAVAGLGHGVKIRADFEHVQYPVAVHVVAVPDGDHYTFYLVIFSRRDLQDALIAMDDAEHRGIEGYNYAESKDPGKAKGTGDTGSDLDGFPKTSTNRIWPA